MSILHCDFGFNYLHYDCLSTLHKAAALLETASMILN